MVETRPKYHTHQTRRAYGLGMVNGILFNMGWAFVDPNTVLPTFVAGLTDSKELVGLISFIGVSGWLLPQLLAARWVQHQPYKRPNYVLTASLRVVGWMLAIPCVYFLAGHQPAAALLGFFLGYSLFSFGGGLGGPAFMEIVVKTVPPNRLGSFFANREFWGALGAVGCGFLVKQILAAPGLSFPGNYGLLFVIALSFFLPGWIAFGLIEEPPGPVVEAQSPRAFTGSMVACLRTHRAFRRLLVARILLGASGIALPFYILYCHQVLHTPTAAAGTYLSLQMAGAMSANQVWGRLNDRRSPDAVIVAVAALSLLGPGAALLATVVPLPQAAGRALFGLAFFAIGTTGGGAFIGFTNYLLAIAPEERRPLYVGMLNTFAALPTCLPLLGGLIISFSSYRVLFALATLCSLGGAYTVLRLPPCHSRVAGSSV